MFVIKEYLKKRNISVYSLAKKTGASYSTLNDLVNGKTDIENVRLGLAMSISNALGTSLDELIELCRNNWTISTSQYSIPCRITSKNKSYYADFEYDGRHVSLNLCRVNERTTDYICTIADWEVDKYVTKEKMERF